MTGVDENREPSGIETFREESAEKPVEAPVTDTAKLMADLESMRAENATLRTQSTQAASDAAAARAYSEQIVASLQVAAAQGGNVGDRPVATDRREKFAEDPEAAVNDMFRERVAPIYGEYLKNQSTLNRQLAAERCKDKGWSEYEKEVDEFMESMDPNVKAQPGAYEKALDFVKARNIDKEVDRMVKARLATERGAFVEGPTVGASAPRPKNSPLSDMEKQVARGLGISEEDYAKFRS